LACPETVDERGEEDLLVVGRGFFLALAEGRAVEGRLELDVLVETEGEIGFLACGRSPTVEVLAVDEVAAEVCTLVEIGVRVDPGVFVES